MALTTTDKTQIQSIAKKEIKDFLNGTQVQETLIKKWWNYLLKLLLSYLNNCGNVNLFGKDP